MPEPYDPDDPKNHPRFNEWYEECKQIHAAAVQFKDKTIRPPSFQLWLTIKAREEAAEKKRVQDEAAEKERLRLYELNRPRIRTDNPPLGHVRYAAKIERRKQLITIAIAVAAIGIIASLSVFDNDWISWGVISAFVCAGAIALRFKLSTDLDETISHNRQPYPLHDYLRDFNPLLADRSILRMTIHFHIPLDDNAQRLEAQLDRTTEAKLLPFIITFSEPPEDKVIQEFLHKELVQFQNENQIKILRVAVTISTPIKKPKTGAYGFV